MYQKYEWHDRVQNNYDIWIDINQYSMLCEYPLVHVQTFPKHVTSTVINTVVFDFAMN